MKLSLIHEPRNLIPRKCKNILHTKISDNKVQGKKMYIVVYVATLISRVKGFHADKKQVDIGTKLQCALESENSLYKKALIVKTKEGDTVGHNPDLLTDAPTPEISGGNIVFIEAIVTGEPRSAPEGTRVIGGGIEAPCKYLIYTDKKLKSKIRTLLRKASM